MPALTDAAELHTDSFQSETALDWTSGGIVQVVANGGPAGAGDAFLEVVSTNNLAAHNSNALWTGDFGSIEATSISVDLMNAPGSDPLDMRIVLFGPDSVDNRWTSAVSQNLPADGVWRNVSFPLAEADLVRVMGSSSHSDMITDVVRVMLRHDPGTPSAGGTFVTATLGIDNVQLVGPSISVPGDYNGDGQVNDADYTAWVAAFGTVGESPADGNDDGTVGAADYVIWRNFQENGGSDGSAKAANVPEPSAMVLWVTSIVLFEIGYLQRKRAMS